MNTIISFRIDNMSLPMGGGESVKCYTLLLIPSVYMNNLRQFIIIITRTNVLSEVNIE